MLRSRWMGAAMVWVACGLCIAAPEPDAGVANSVPVDSESSGELDFEAALAALEAEEAQASADPWEGFNRRVFAFNDRLDAYLLKPIAKGYQAVTPRLLDQGVTNFFGNLGEVSVVTNDLLQGKLGQASRDGLRFLVNSTIGFFGLFDVAGRIGLRANNEDFGQTLAVWGVPSGPYLVLPFLGPSSVRGSAALVPESQLSPLRYTEDEALGYQLLGLDVVDTRADLLSAEEVVRGDRYIFVRDAYLQRREFLIQDGQVEDEFDF